MMKRKLYRWTAGMSLLTAGDWFKIITFFVKNGYKEGFLLLVEYHVTTGNYGMSRKCCWSYFEYT